MYIEPVKCECGTKTYRVRAQTGKEDIPLGYYCPRCQAILDTNRDYLVPATLITRMDPYFTSVPKRDAYLAILKNGDRLVPPTITNEKIDNARNMIVSAATSSCRAPSGRAIPRLDREKVCRELQKSFELHVQVNEMKEASGNQPES